MVRIGQGEKSLIPGVELGKQRWHSATPGQGGNQNPDSKLGWQRLLLNLPPEMDSQQPEESGSPQMEELLMNLSEEESESPGFDLLEDEEATA